MADFTKPITETIAERAKNPIIGSFMLSWLSFNFGEWTTLAFSNSGSFEERLATFQGEMNFWTFFFWPFLIGVGVYLATIILSYCSGLINIEYRNRITKKSTNLAISEHQLALHKEHGRKYEVVISQNEKLKESHEEIKATLEALLPTLNKYFNTVNEFELHFTNKLQNTVSMFRDQAHPSISGKLGHILTQNEKDDVLREFDNQVDKIKTLTKEDFRASIHEVLFRELPRIEEALKKDEKLFKVIEENSDH